MSDGLVQILDGNTFVVSDSRGDIEASLTDPTGLFSFDTRFLSKWILTLDGERLNPLSVDDLQYFETRFFLVPGTGTVYVDAKLSVIRRRAVGDGFHEELTLLNHDEKPVEITVRIEAASDFADLFEVKDALKKKGKYSADVDEGLVAARLLTRDVPARDDDLLFGPCDLRRDRPHASGSDRAARCLDHRPGRRHGGRHGGTYTRPKYHREGSKARPNMERSLDKWLEDAPRVGVRLGAVEDHVQA